MSETFFLFGFKGVMFLWVLAGIALVNQWLATGSSQKYVFSFLIGTVLSAIMLAFAHALTFAHINSNPFIAALGIVVIIGMWKFLFGPWSPSIKSAVLGTFLFWIIVDIAQQQSEAERVAMLLASFVAIIPATVWCFLFLREHRSRLSLVILTFLAGMLSTAPILFYDHVVRKGYELHFFLFRITPENFMRSSETFVSEYITAQEGIVSTNVGVTVVSFILVAVIEEWSKLWVTRNSNRAFFRSVGDVVQLCIIAAIGFAFAENIINPNYFIAFVQDYLVTPETPQWGLFIGSVMGRSIVTNMVHIVSSGMLGYFFGLAFFGKSILEYQRAHGARHRFISWLHRLLRIDKVVIFREINMVLGLLCAFTLHGAFNTITSLPDVLPGRPNTLGQLIGYDGFMSQMSIIALPAMFYVFGGWFLLTYIFHRQQDQKEFIESDDDFEQESIGVSIRGAA